MTFRCHFSILGLKKFVSQGLIFLFNAFLIRLPACTDVQRKRLICSLLGTGVKSWKVVKTVRACRRKAMETSWKRGACRHVVFFGLCASSPGEDFAASPKRRRRRPKAAAAFLGGRRSPLPACSHEVQKTWYRSKITTNSQNGEIQQKLRFKLNFSFCSALN